MGGRTWGKSRRIGRSMEEKLQGTPGYLAPEVWSGKGVEKSEGSKEGRKRGARQLRDDQTFAGGGGGGGGGVRWVKEEQPEGGVAEEGWRKRMERVRREREREREREEGEGEEEEEGGGRGGRGMEGEEGGVMTAMQCVCDGDVDVGAAVRGGSGPAGFASPSAIQTFAG
eukprot:646161-Hanusia_phi.AAC.1